MYKKHGFILFASLLGLTCFIFLYAWLYPWSLTVYSPKKGEVLDRLPLQSNATFTLKYIHSVTHRDVSGTFAVTKEGKIKPLTTTFDAYGPGLPVLDGSLRYFQKNGAYTVFHEEEPRKMISLFVSPLTRERLVSAAEEINISRFADAPQLLHIFPERKFHYNKFKIAAFTLGVNTNGQD